YVYHDLMSLRHALLALLAATPMTGYALAKHFEQSAAFLWHAPHSQIYPELRRMEAEGLLAGHEQPRGTRGTKRSYALTEAGIAGRARAEAQWARDGLALVDRLEAAATEVLGR